MGRVEGQHRLLTVTGPDAVTFLQGLISQDLTVLDAGHVARSFFLQPNGKLAALLWVGSGVDEVLLFCDAGVAEALVTQLGRYRIRVAADVILDDRAVIEFWGPDTYDSFDVEAGEWRRTDESIVFAAPLGGLGRVFTVGLEVSAPAIGSLARTAVRVEAGEPIMGVDVDEKTIPQETGLVDASVSFEKGCYLGQELVARIDTRGHVNRRLVGIQLTQSVVPPHGAGVWVDDRQVGTITSPCESLTMRAPLGLGIIRREVDAGDKVEVRWEFDGTTQMAKAVIVELPFDDFTNP